MNNDKIKVDYDGLSQMVSKMTDITDNLTSARKEISKARSSTDSFWYGKNKSYFDNNCDNICKSIVKLNQSIDGVKKDINSIVIVKFCEKEQEVNKSVETLSTDKMFGR